MITEGPALVEALAQAAVADGTSVLIQYGALGAVALLALAAVRVLFQREVQALDLERKRADRLEQELRALNTAIQDKYVATLTAATHAISEALEVTRERR